MKKIIWLIILLVLMEIAYANIDECTRKVSTFDLPCMVISPSTGDNCSTISIEFYYFNTTLMDTRIMDYYGETGRCNTTFNLTLPGTYLFNLSNFDTGEIIVGDDAMQFFNLTVFVSMGLFGILFILFMHIFQNKADESKNYKNYGISIALGSFASIFWYILGFLVFKGLNPLNSTDTVFGISINVYIGMVCMVIGLYSTIFSIRLYDYTLPKKDEFGELSYNY